MPHSLDRTGLTFYRGGECGCRDTGYLRPPAPHDWARELPGALVKSMELVAEGRPPLVGVLGEWRRDEDSWSRYDAGTAWAYVYDRANSHGVAWRAPGGLRGPETGTAGMAAADKAAQDTYWLLGPKEEG